MHKNVLFVVLLAVVMFFSFQRAAVSQEPDADQKEMRLKEKARVNEPWEKRADTNRDGIVDVVEIRQWREMKDQNMGGSSEGSNQGQQWEGNPPGPKGGPGAGPDHMPMRDRDGNPPGPKGGLGVGSDSMQMRDRDGNPPGPKGGPGKSPNVQHKSENNRGGRVKAGHPKR